ncbi:phosphopantetheine-binding protein [Nostoc sp. CMAA1605]|uniref:phosphopantetheine-binding protein n=1 Tax=Nostoc sp. CMAA1605 TaxID=2055159 RepID=UPI001F245A09|nr:phosphopantetheine-binding protein [Nostoc sp. CMAA1605]
MLPSAFILLDEIPLTPNGKVDKQALLSYEVIPTIVNKSSVAANTFTELALVKIWEQLLNTSPIGITDNFFELGGHSFLAVRLIAQIYELFGHNLSYLSSLKILQLKNSPKLSVNQQA